MPLASHQQFAQVVRQSGMLGCCVPNAYTLTFNGNRQIAADRKARVHLEVRPETAGAPETTQPQHPPLRRIAGEVLRSQSEQRTAGTHQPRAPRTFVDTPAGSTALPSAVRTA